MRNIVIAVIALIVVLAALLGARYELVVNSPIVAKMDRLTGEVWIVNAGMWRKVEMPAQTPAMKTAAVPEKAKAKS